MTQGSSPVGTRKHAHNDVEMAPGTRQGNQISLPL